MNARELPIIFTAESVRAILSGAKTQTRRVAKFVPHDGVNMSFSGLSVGHYCTGEPELGWCLYSTGEGGMWNQRSDRLFSRYNVGDVLWVKEAWGLHCYLDDTYWYHGNIDGWSRDDVLASWSPAYRADWGPNQEGCFWRSPLYMPRWASRIALEVTEVRAQRVQDISEEDAKAEGVDPYIGGEGPVSRESFYCDGGFHNYDHGKAFRNGFKFTWHLINGKRSPWSRNDFVFAYTFRRIEK